MPGIEAPSDEEARAAAESGDLDTEIQQIRLRHATARVEEAVENGRLPARLVHCDACLWTTGV